MQELNQTLSFTDHKSFGITSREIRINSKKGLFKLFSNDATISKSAYELNGAVFANVSEKEVNSFYSTWQTLIMNPLYFSYDSETSVEDVILREQSKFHETQMLKMVLSKEFDFDLNSIEVLNATKNCRKIFHEDYPGNYILEFQGNRLGMFELSICKNSLNEYNLKYHFKSNIKRFY